MTRPKQCKIDTKATPSASRGLGQPFQPHLASRAATCHIAVFAARLHFFFERLLDLGWAMRQAMVSTSVSSSTTSSDSVSVV